MFSNIFTSEALAEAWNIIRTQFPLALWETFYVTVLATAFAIVIGLPLAAGRSRYCLPCLCGGRRC